MQIIFNAEDKKNPVYLHFCGICISSYMDKKTS